ncbi:hypothetical protein NVP1081O_152 [Vibrio phage 1.081.O._10N.286.52.C2]|nr:hypothetical protein NVP1081O_152 [Vibrio phage 1.081.O._10N.286.52.C2]
MATTNPDNMMMNEYIDYIIAGIEAGETQSFCVLKYTPSEIVKRMEERGYSYEMETNGWQCDFWIEFRKDDCKVIQLNGCWYYGQAQMEWAEEPHFNV